MTMRRLLNPIFLLLLGMLCSGALLSRAQVQSQPVRLYMVVDTDDQSRCAFATDFAARVFKNQELASQKPEVRMYLLGDGFQFMIDGPSDTAATIRDFALRNFNFKMIGCGKALPTMRGYLRDGKMKLLPGVELTDEPCTQCITRLVEHGWYEVRIPEKF